MRQLDGLLIWLGIGAFILFMALFSFYALSFLLPIILVLMGISFLLHQGRRLYWNYKDKNPMSTYRSGKKESRNPKIIDVEYEIIDEDKK